MKKIIAAVSALALVLCMTGIAKAATFNGINDDSTAHSLAQWLLRVVIRNTNDAEIYNNATATANSGGNVIQSADDQTKTSLTTGDASAAVVVDNTANGNSVTEDLESADTADNSFTQVNDESTATAESSDEITDDVQNLNTVRVENNVEATANTGDNEITSEDSLTETTVHTGVNDSATGITNLFNMNVKDIIRTIRCGL